jgi:hypothetical protein
MLLDGALKMLSAQTSAAAKSMVELNIIEIKRRLEFLEGALKKFDDKESSTIIQNSGVIDIKHGFDI